MTKENQVANLSRFKNSPDDYPSLATGSWILNQSSVWQEIKEKGKEDKLIPVCTHPIQPVECLKNLDTHIEKMKIGYRRRGIWSEIIVDKQLICNKNKIIELADYGIAVNSENARFLSNYLLDVEVLNEEYIPFKKSIGRLGWIPNHGFSPYDEELVFDGDSSCKQVFDSVVEKGDFNLWLNTMKEIRANGITARILLAASFSAVLVEPLKKLPFFVHLWGGSNAGKTVSLLMAASVWGNPNEGHLMKSFNATQIGLELLATAHNSIPLCINELQIDKDKNMDNTIYNLCEGTGKTRGNKSLGVARVGTWRNCILTNGEQPITRISSGAGAINRVLEIECTEALFKDPVKIANITRANYGFAGKIFVNYIKDNMDEILKTYNQVYAKMTEYDVTDKQAMAASLVVVADLFATRVLFKDANNVKVKEIVEFLGSETHVSASDRAYALLTQWVAANSAKFEQIETGEKFGKYRSETDRSLVYIIASKFDSFLYKEGFHSKPVISWLARHNLIESNIAGNKYNTRINGSVVSCIALKLNVFEPVDYIENPFE